VVVTGMNVIQVGSYGQIFALTVGGILFAFLAILIEPLLGFFKFPINFWGLMIVGFLLNLLYFFVLSTGILPAMVILETGNFGGEFSPLPFPVIFLGNKFMVAIFAALIATLLQILFRKLGE
jgi:hypothetical protein